MLLDRQIGDRPKDPELRFARAQFFSRRRLWAHAEPEFREFLRLRPVETWGETDRDTWVAMRISAQLAKMRDFDEHRRLSRALIDHFAQSSSPSALERIAKACLLTPPDKELPQLIEMTDRAVRLGESHPFLPWFELARGLAAYRAGKFLETTNWLRPLLETQWHGLGMSTARVYLAMAEHQLGNSQQALEHIASVRGTHAEMLDAGADWGDGWHDWLILELALEEAEALVSAAPGPPVEPNPGDR
jgi:tetratricopeptide (TPR) repeat protein